MYFLAEDFSLTKKLHKIFIRLHKGCTEALQRLHKGSTKAAKAAQQPSAQSALQLVITKDTMKLGKYTTTNRANCKLRSWCHLLLEPRKIKKTRV